MKTKKIITTVLTFLFLSVPALAFDVTFKNTFDRKIYYIMWWIDHPYEWPGPANMAGGELQPNSKHELDVDWSPGTYYVKWWDENNWESEMVVSIKDDIDKIFFTPNTHYGKYK